MRTPLISLLALVTSGAAFAASTFPAQVFGTVASSSIVSNTTNFVCTLEDGRVEFQRAAPTSARPNPPAVIGLPRFATYNAQTGDGYQGSSGMVVLNFTSATTGNLHIDYDYSASGSLLPSGESVPFRAYRESWSPSTSTGRILFNVVFEHCTLPVRILLRGPT